MKLKSFLNWMVFLFLFFDVVLSQTTFFVATTGNDNNPGTIQKPFASIFKARDAVREAKKKRFKGTITVYLRKGYYQIDDTFVLESEDSGNKNLSVTYQSYEKEKAHLIGGKKIDGLEKISDPSIIARLDEKSMGKVFQVDLKTKGINEFRGLSARGFGQEIQPSHIELFFNEKPMTLSRWPNKGWAKIADTITGLKESGFVFEGDRPAKWAKNNDIWLHGYWSWDWADSYVKVGNIDLKNHIINTLPPHGVYGYSKGKRYYALNILEEIDEPGEYYLDKETGILYFWPPEPLNSGDLFVSLLKDPIISIRNTSNIIISNLIIEYTCGIGIEIIGGSDNLIAGCTIRNIGTLGVSIGKFEPNIGNIIYRNTLYKIDAGFNNGVRSCDIYQCGEGGITVCGGDRITLNPGNNFVENNHIWDCCRWARTYRPAVFMWGVGNLVRNNLIHDLPHTALFLWGNNHLIEYNEIHNVCLETGDAGAFYLGRDWTQRGSIIRYNYFHDLQGIKGQPGFIDVMGVYLDDLASGTTVYSNIFYKAGRSIMIGGGRDNVIDNNIIIDGEPALHVDGRANGWMASYMKNPNYEMYKRLDTVNYKNPLYSIEFPQLINLLQDSPTTPKGNKITKNIIVGGKPYEYLDGVDNNLVYFKDNLINEDPGFLSVEKKNYRLKINSHAHKIGFKEIPQEKIGLYKDKYRN